MSSSASVDSHPSLGTASFRDRIGKLVRISSMLEAGQRPHWRDGTELMRLEKKKAWKAKQFSNLRYPYAQPPCPIQEVNELIWTSRLKPNRWRRRLSEAIEAI